MKALNWKHELFCRNFVECASGAAAAKAAGYAPASARNAGYRLLRRPAIVQRIAEMQRETAHQHCRDVDVLLGKLETVYRRAVDDHNFAAAARAVEMQARLSGISAPASRARGKAAAAVADATGLADGGGEHDGVEDPQQQP